MNSTRPAPRNLRGVCLWLASLAVAASAAPAPQLPDGAAKMEPAYWRQRVFLIPYRFAPEQPLADQVDKVRLLISEEPAGEWRTLEEAQPHVRGFSFFAPRDGDFWFAVQMVDRRGKTWPSGTIKPQLHVVVDTQLPELRISAGSDASGRATLRYSASDPYLQLDSLVVEVKADDAWKPAPISQADVSQKDRLMGRLEWTPPTSGGVVHWRATVADRAGNRTTAATEWEVGPSQTVVNPFFRGPSAEAPVAGNDGPSLHWPPTGGTQVAGNRASVARAAAPSRQTSPGGPPVSLPPLASEPTRPLAVSKPPPFQNPYTESFRDPASRVPAQFAADAPTDAAPSPLRNPPAARDMFSPGQRPASPSGGADRLVNSATFDLEYDLQAVGPWGVAKVALWGTRDGGRTWSSYAVDDDNRSPIRVTVPGGGTYGFRILVDSAGGADAPPPQPGDSPELTVAVDLHRPTAELIAAEIGRDHLTDHLLVRWSATDSNLQPRPIGLFYSASPEGPWSTIATNLSNSGQYAWRLERHVPVRFYLRLEVRDEADNLAVAVTPSPIALERPQPKGFLRSVRPVEQAPLPPVLGRPRDQTARSVDAPPPHAR
ncbi:hypothetical protein OAS39_11575 [Pirellulales bacterium]|nr:hypothetical protein [Pirellulales bacterium]